MNKQIEEINRLVKEHIGQYRKADERLFELGVELGRLLAKSSIDNYRLPFFIEQKNFENQAKQKEVLIKKAEALILKIVLNAYKAELANGNGIYIEPKSYSGRSGHLSEDTISKFGIVHTGTEQNGDGGDFKLKFCLQGLLSEIFQRHKVPPSVSVSVSNPTGEDNDAIYEVEELEANFYSLRLSIFHQNTILTVDQLQIFLNDLEKNMLFTLIKGN